MAPPIIADRRLYLTGDKTRVVEEGDTSAAFLLAGAGGGIAAEDAVRLDLTIEAGRIVIGAQAAQAAQKAMAKPADKARKRGEDK